MSSKAVIAAGLAMLSGAAAAQPKPELLFQAEAQTLSGVCAGQGVRVEGNHNTLTLSGVCGSLLLKGVANTVRLGLTPGGAIHVEGSGNRVQYTAQGAAPAIVALGPDNDVAASAAPPQSASAAPQQSAAASPKQAAAAPKPAIPSPPSGPLVLAGDDQQHLAECGGRDVTVSGNRSADVLRGGCKSLVVRGDLVAVQAEMAPGAKITVAGRGSIVSWAVKAKGRPPVSLVRGEGSRVQRAETIGGEKER